MPEIAISTLLSRYTELLAMAGADSPRLCAELIVGEAARLGRAQLLAFGERTLNREEQAACEGMLARRMQGEPMAYILGRKEFYGREFMVSPAVLIPRPETELLVDLALHRLDRAAPVRFADLGCGSGCLLASLLAEAPAWTGVGVDISPAALEICAANLQRLLGESAAVEAGPVPEESLSRASLRLADFAGSGCLPAAHFDLIVSNPPYISSLEYQTLEPGVRNFEPRLALESGEDGLYHARQVAALGLRALRPGGLLLMEIGCEQGAAALRLFSGQPWAQVELVPDLAGLDRVILARRACNCLQNQ